MSESAPARKGRPPVARARIVAALRQRIVDGTLRPDQRLPSTRAIEKQFRTHTRTVEEAIRHLRTDGFLESRSRRGTFVVRHPPHLTHFALTFPFAPGVRPSQFYEAIRQEALGYQRPERRVLVFYDIEAHADVEDYRRLLAFAEAQRLAGLIFGASPHGLRNLDSPLLRDPALPRVAIAHPAPWIECPSVYPDSAAFLPKALAYLAACGRRRVAVITKLGDTGFRTVAPVMALAAEHGLILRPEWLQAADPGQPFWGEQVGRVLFHDRQSERPDALVITDDNLVPAVTAGVAAAGVSTSAEVTVVAHANFPYPTPSALPAVRLGFDVRELVRWCMKRIEEQRRGCVPPAHTALPPLWEGERPPAVAIAPVANPDFACVATSQTSQQKE